MKIQHKTKGYIVEGKGLRETQDSFHMEHYGKFYSYSKTEYKRYRKPSQKKQEEGK